jgi:hypothetical protein
VLHIYIYDISNLRVKYRFPPLLRCVSVRLFLLRKVLGYGLVCRGWIPGSNKYFFLHDHVGHHFWGSILLPFQWVLGAVSFELKRVKCSIEVKDVLGINLAALHVHGSVLMHGDGFAFIITGS